MPLLIIILSWVKKKKVGGQKGKIEKVKGQKGKLTQKQMGHENGVEEAIKEGKD